MDTRDIEASMAQMKAAIAARGSEADARTAALQDHGLPWPLAHRVHPVWGQALREATQQERRWDIETGPLFPWEHEARWFVMADLEAEHAASGDPASLAHQDIIAGLEDAARAPMEEPSGTLLVPRAEPLQDLSRYAEEQQPCAIQDRGMRL
jgi:hypothetical protein